MSSGATHDARPKSSIVLALHPVYWTFEFFCSHCVRVIVSGVFHYQVRLLLNMNAALLSLSLSPSDVRLCLTLAGL